MLKKILELGTPKKGIIYFAGNVGRASVDDKSGKYRDVMEYELKASLYPYTHSDSRGICANSLEAASCSACIKAN